MPLSRKLMFCLALMMLVLLFIVGIDILSRYIPPFSHSNNIPWEYSEEPDLGWMNISLPDADPDKFRIMVIGGSNTVARKGNYMEVFENEMKRCSSNIQVINLGVAGYGTAQEYIMWTRYKDKYNPHIVMLAFTGANDFSDNLDDMYYGPVFSIGRAHFVLLEGELKKISPKPIKRFLAKYSNMFRYLEAYFAYHFPEIFGAYVQEHMEPFQEFYKPSSKRAKNGVEITQALIQTLNKEVEDNDGKLIIHAIDNAFTVEKELYDKLAVQYGEQFTNLDLFYPVNSIEKFSIKNNIPFINLTNYILEHKKSHPHEHIIIPNIAGHLTPVGNKLVGSTVAKEMIERELISCH
jgi:hypothetical protein